MELETHADALGRVRHLPVPPALFAVRASWFVDADSIAHVRRHHEHPDDVAVVNGTLEEFITSGHCAHERCSTWVNAIGDDVIIASQVATAVVQAWTLLDALASGTRVLGRIDALNQLSAPFDRVETITGEHPLVEIYRAAAHDAYTDRQDSYIADLRNARMQIVDAAVDHLARARGVFAELDALLAGSNRASHLAAQLPSTRADLVRLRAKVDASAPTQLSQFDTISAEAVHLEPRMSLTETLTAVWRESVLAACTRTSARINELAAAMEQRPMWVAGIRGTDTTLPIPYTSGDLAHAFAWRPHARLAMLPASVAAVVASNTDWELVEVSGPMSEDVLETCETLWDPTSEEFRRLATALAAAARL